MQYKVRKFVVPTRINKVKEVVSFAVAGANSDGVTITISDVDGDQLQFRFDNTLFENGAAGNIVLLPSADTPSQAVRTQRLFDAIMKRDANSGLQVQVSRLSDTEIKFEQLQGGAVATVALSNALGGTITEITAGTDGIVNPAFGDDLRLSPSNLGFNPASSGMSKVQVTCLDHGGTFGMRYRPVGTSDYLQFIDPVAGQAADAGDDLILLGREDDPIFDSIEVTFQNPDAAQGDIVVFATFFERK
tara:strand:- start:2854 stop:3591 length:738 start_codon:yes stop_codon:yes gene_type:complete